MGQAGATRGRGYGEKGRGFEAGTPTGNTAIGKGAGLQERVRLMEGAWLRMGRGVTEGVWPQTKGCGYRWGRG